MDKKQEGKSQAEIYREQRKERLAKAAKKSGKKGAPDIKPVSSKANKAVSIAIIAVAVIAVAGWLLNFFGVPQKMTYVMNIGDTKISEAEYSYYYMSNYNNIVSMTNYYDQMYGGGTSGIGKMFTGFDTAKAPGEQEYTGTDMEAKEDGSKPTWEEYLCKVTNESLQQQVMLCGEAKAAGMELTEDEIKEIDDQLTQLQEQAANNDYSLNAYLRVAYGKGVSRNMLREAMLDRTLANKYAESKGEELAGSVTDAEIDAQYEANKDTYDVATLRYFGFAATAADVAEDATDEEKAAAKEQAKADAKAKAEAMLAKVSDSATFKAQALANATDLQKTTYEDDAATLFDGKKKSDVQTKLGDAGADWAFSADRKAGDKTVVEANDYAYVLLMVEPRGLDTTGTVDVRHILVKYADDATDENKAEVKQKAEDLLNEWKSGEKTEDSFAALATEKTEDTGSKETGGLYEGVTKGQMVADFDAWIFDGARKPGDTGLVESTYGIHVMYFVKKNETPQWRNEAKTAVGDEKYEAYVEDLKNSDAYKLETKDKRIAKLSKKYNKDIASSLALNKTR